MYSFQTNAGKRKTQHRLRLLYFIIFLLLLLLAGVTFSYVRGRAVSEATSEAIVARVLSEASEAQSAAYRLTQSSGTNTMTLLSNLRSHIYALECLNTLASGIYGAGTTLTDPELLNSCEAMLTECETRLQAGSVLTTQMNALKETVDQIVTLYGTPAA